MGSPSFPEVDEMLMIDPRRRSIICGSAPRATRKGPRALTPMTRSHSLTGSSVTGARLITPATLTTTSIVVSASAPLNSSLTEPGSLAST